MFEKVMAALAGRGRKTLADKNKLLEDKVQFLENLLAKKELELAEARRRWTDQGAPPLGNKTALLRDFAIVGHYLFDKDANPALAEKWLDFTLDSIGSHELEFFSYLKRDGKIIYFLDERHEEDLCLRSRYSVFSRADQPHSARVAERVHQACTENGKIKTGKIVIAGKYIISERILGRDLSSFYAGCKNKDVVLMLLMKQLRDSAFVSTRCKDLPQAASTSHSKKALEVFKEAGVYATNLENAVTRVFDPLDRGATLPFRDAAAWNFLLDPKAESIFSSGLLPAESAIDQAVYSIDFDNLSRRTFQSDDAIHVLEWPVPELSGKERKDLEKYYVQCLKAHGEDVSAYFSNSSIKGAYRHMRTWLLYSRKRINYPDSLGSKRLHHARMFSRHLEKSGIEFSDNDAYNCLRKLRESMMEACSRA